MVANWYRRNFRIAANIHATAEDCDRLAIIYGSGHLPVLEHALSMTPRFSLVDRLDYLQMAQRCAQPRALHHRRRDPYCR